MFTFKRTSVRTLFISWLIATVLAASTWSYIWNTSYWIKKDNGHLIYLMDTNFNIKKWNLFILILSWSRRINAFTICLITSSIWLVNAIIYKCFFLQILCRSRDDCFLYFLFQPVRDRSLENNCKMRFDAIYDISIQALTFATYLPS